LPDISDVRIHLMVDNAQAISAMRTTETAVRSSAARMSTTIAGWATSMNRVGVQMQSIGRYMTTFVTLPVAALGVVATKSALDMERTFLKIQTLATGVGMSMDEAREKVTELSHALAVDPQELAEGLYFVASAGLENAEDVFPVLEAAAKAAAVGMGDTATVAQLLTGVMNNYAKSGMDAATATEILTEAVAQGKAEPAEFAAYLGSALAVAAQMGVSFDEVAAAVANATVYQIDAARAATGLRYALSALANPSDEAIATLKDYGLTVAGVQDSLAGPAGLLGTYQMLADTFDITSTAGKAAWQTVIGGARAAILVNTLVGENAKKTEDIFDSLASAAEGSTDRMEKAWKKYERSDAFKFDQMKADLKAAMIDLGESIIPVLIEDVLPVIQELIDGWNGLSDATKRTIIIWGGVAAAAGPIIMTFGTLLRLMSGIIRLGAGAAGAIATALGAGSAATGGAGGVAALTGSAASLTAIGTGLAYVATGLAAVYTAHKILTGADPTFVPELGAALAGIAQDIPEIDRGLRGLAGTAAPAAALNELMESVRFPEGYTNEAATYERKVRDIVDAIYAAGGAVTELDRAQFHNLQSVGDMTAAFQILKDRLRESRSEMEDLKVSIEDLPSSKYIEIIADTKDAMASVQTFYDWVQAMPAASLTINARLYRTDWAEGWIPPPQGKNTAMGGIVTGPVLTGEGAYSTFAGRGAEAVIPLDGRGLGILAEALARAGARQRGGNRTVVVNVAGKVERPEDIKRELMWWEKTRGW